MLQTSFTTTPGQGGLVLGVRRVGGTIGPADPIVEMAAKSKVKVELQLSLVCVVCAAMVARMVGRTGCDFSKFARLCLALLIRRAKPDWPPTRAPDPATLFVYWDGESLQFSITIIGSLQSETRHLNLRMSPTCLLALETGQAIH